MKIQTQFALKMSQTNINYKRSLSILNIYATKRTVQTGCPFMAFVGGIEPSADRLGGGSSILLRYTNIN